MVSPKMNRRHFLKVTGATAAIGTGIGAMFLSGKPPAYAQGTRLHVLRWADFIPESDVELKRQAQEASKVLGAEVFFEFISSNDLQSRITASIQSGSGADIAMLLWNWPHLYANALVDVSDVAEEIGKAQGGFYDTLIASAKVGGRWLAVPHSQSPEFINYRRSWYAEIGIREFPDTWDGWRESAKKLKAKGKPNGQEVAHGLDSSSFFYPLLWSFGGAEVDESGKKVIINSKNTIESVKFMQAFWKDACDEGGLGWDDTSNNRAFHAGELSSTVNGASIYIVAKRQQDAVKDEKGVPLYLDIEHTYLPKGPGGQFHLNTPKQHAIMKYSKNQKLAKDFLRWLHRRENYDKWFEVEAGFDAGPTKAMETSPIWSKIDKPLVITRQASRMALMIGYKGPASAKTTEVYTKYLIVDMYAKAVQGMAAEDAVKWAEGELKKIYEA